MTTNDNEINLFDWNNSLSFDGAMNVVYDDDVRLMNIMFALMKFD